MQRSRTEPVDVLIVLMSLVAEGTPQLALQLARQWQRDGLRVEVMVLQPDPRNMQAEFEALGLPLHHVNLGQGLGRYWALLRHTFRICRRRRVRREEVPMRRRPSRFWEMLRRATHCR